MTALEVKTALGARGEEFARWLFPAGKKIGQEWHVGALSGEAGKSLSICIGGAKAGVFADFATGDSGDNLVELYSQSKRVAFKDALHACADWLGQPLTRRASAPQQPVHVNRSSSVSAEPGDIYSPSDDECREAIRMLEALSSDNALCERIARTRNWKPETIRQLALEGYLGWHEEKLAFVYDTGVKRRWRENGERIIRWLFGKPWIWRGAWLHAATTVYICEGETDCITLIDAGIETDPSTLAVAIPSASTFSADWAQLFAGKDVILAFDSDDAGRTATEKVSRLLCPHVRKLSQINWGGLKYAS